MLDVVATMLYDQEVKAAAREFINTVEKSLAGQEDGGYWNRIFRKL